MLLQRILRVFLGSIYSFENPQYINILGVSKLFSEKSFKIPKNIEKL